MKAFIFFLVTFSLTSFSSSQQGWFQQSSGTANYLYAAYFVSPNTGWVVGQASTVLKTTNAGVNWFTQNPVAPGFLYSVYFISESTGWVVGQSGAVYKTTNAGANWSAQTSGFPSNYLYSVCFTDVSFGYIVGSGGLILKTMNGGNNWVQQTSGVSNTLSCVYFPPSATSMIGYAVGGTATEGVVLKTSSAGSSWTLKTLGTNWLFGVHFDNVQLGWAVGYSGTIYSTLNGGDNWIPQTSGTTNRLVAVHFPNASTGYAVGYSGTIVKTTNSGTNWFTQVSPSTNNLWGTFFTDENTGWAAGWNGTILHTTNGGVTYINKISSEIPRECKLYQNYPNPFNPVTKIKFDLSKSNLILSEAEGLKVKIIVFDILGKEVAELFGGYLNPGAYETQWDASSYSSGIYFYSLIAGNYLETKKMLLIK